MTTGAVTGIGAVHEATVAATLGRAAGVRLVRRCPDVADLLAVCTAGRADVALLSADFHGLDRSAVGALRSAGVGVVGVHPSGAEEDQRVLRQWGVHTLVPVDATPEELSIAVLRTDDQLEGTGGESPSLEDELAAMDEPAGVPVPDEPAVAESVIEASYLPDAPDAETSTGPMPGPEFGEVVTVWGPVGAPGRTVLAVNLAAEAARLGIPTVLVDADTCAASVAQHLALLDEAPGVAAATRLADAGHLDLASLAASAPEVVPGLRVLTGLPRADRWPEVRDDALTAVLDQCRRLARLVVIDVAAPLEQDEELSYDTLAPRRNAATIAALEAATTVLAVGSADPVGLQRLVRGLDELRAVAGEPPLVVANKVRATAVGARPEQRVTEALQRFAGVQAVRTVPDDRDACDAALLSGRVLAEQAPSSPARRAIVALAAELTGAVAMTRRGWFAGRR